MGRIILFGVICAGISLPACAQPTFLPFGETTPQAATRDELDAFGKIYETAEPAAVIRLAEAFIERYPKSEFLQYVNVPLLHAYERTGESRKARDTALAILRLNPDNVDALLSLAAYRLKQHAGPEPGEALLPARQYAQHALERIRSFKAPVTANRPVWINTKRALLAKSYMLLGLAAADEKQLDEAITHLGMATEIDPQGEYFYRLCLAYEAAGHRGEAISSAMRAQELGPEPVSRLAQRKIALLRDSTSSPAKRGPAVTSPKKLN